MLMSSFRSGDMVKYVGGDTSSYIGKQGRIVLVEWTHAMAIWDDGTKGHPALRNLDIIGYEVYDSTEKL